MTDFIALFDRLHFPVIVVLAMIGLYVLIASRNVMKRVAGFAILQCALVVFFLTLGWVAGGRAPIVQAGETPYGRLFSDPAPQALMLGVVVCAAATIALALALAVRVREAYASAELDEIDAIDDGEDRAERGA